MSTRVAGAGPAVILITAKAILAAGEAYLALTVTQESGDLWRYNLSEGPHGRAGYGKVIVPGHMAALRRAAGICANGYQPGSTSAASWTPSSRTCHDTRPSRFPARPLGHCRSWFRPGTPA